MYGWNVKPKEIPKLHLQCSEAMLIMQLGVFSRIENDSQLYHTE